MRVRTDATKSEQATTRSCASAAARSRRSALRSAAVDWCGAAPGASSSTNTLAQWIGGDTTTRTADGHERLALASLRCGRVQKRTEDRPSATDVISTRETGSGALSYPRHQ